MYFKRFFGAMFVLAVSSLCLADGPISGAEPPDFGPQIPPPAPAAGEPTRGWIFLSYPHARFSTPLYHLRGEIKNVPSVCLWSNARTNDHADVMRAFNYSRRLDLSVGGPRGVSGVRQSHFVSIASNDILPINGRLVKFERADFPADYPQKSIPRNVIHAGLRWTDVTDDVPVDVRPTAGWPLILATFDREKQSGQHRLDYGLFPDRDQSKAIDEQRPSYVRVLDIVAGPGEGEMLQAEIEITTQVSRLERKTVRRLSVTVGESIEHDERAHRVLKIVPPQKIEGTGNLIGWVEVEMN